MVIPKSIDDRIKEKVSKADEIGMSLAKVLIYDDLVLKIEKESYETKNQFKVINSLKNIINVPKIIEHEVENGYDFLLTSKLEGKMASDDSLLLDKKYLIEKLCRALNILWSVDINKVDTDNNLDKKLEEAKFRVLNNLVDTNDFEEDTMEKYGFKSPYDIYKYLIENKPKEDLVFSHGDFCLPNILINDNNEIGFIDLGRASISCKYNDIALCYRSLKHNLEGRYSKKKFEKLLDEELFSELEITPDYDKLNYYILLDELF